MSLLPHVQKFKYANTDGFVPLFVDGYCFGVTQQFLADALAGYKDAWVRRDNGLHIHPALVGFEARSKVLDDVMLDLSARGVLPHEPDYALTGGSDWFPIGPNRKQQALFKIRRFYAVHFGTQFDSVIVNGFEAGRYWCAIRSQYVEHAKGKRDVIVAGCVRIENSIEEEILDEGRKECGMRPEDLAHIKLVNRFQIYWHTKAGFLRNETFHIYDFDVKDVFTPHVADENEVSGFETYDFTALRDIILTDDVFFKPEIKVVVIDFLMRHKVLTAAHPEYTALLDLIQQTKDFYAHS